MSKKIILTLSIILFFIVLFFVKHFISIFYFQNDLNKIAINFEEEKIENTYICFNQNCDEFNFLNGIYSYKLNQQNPIFYNGSVENIEILTKNKNLTNKDVSIFIGNSFENKTLKEPFEVEFQNDKYYSYNISISTNSKNVFQKIAIYFEGIFYNWFFFILSYGLILFYLVKKKEIINLNSKYLIYLILALGLFLRLSHINFIPLWNDELYTLCNISNLGSGFNFKNTFQDAGNPPLFFILSNFWLMFFNKNILLIRLLPCLIGLAQIYSIYFVAKKLINEKTALICAFLSAINIFIILESNEIRSYILSMCLILWSLFYFHKLYENFKIKTLIFYSLCTILLINLHYYCILYCIGNFILGLIIFKNNRIKFSISNIISFLTIIPYLFISFKNSINPGFNTWLEKPSLILFNNHITFYFGNILFLIFTIIFSIYIFKKLEKNEKNIFIYCTYSIVFVFLSALIISFSIKPILFERYFCIFLPLLILNTGIFLTYDFNTKFKPIILTIIFLFSINMPKYENFNLFSNIDLMAKYSSFDFKKQNNYESYFVIPDYINYIDYYKDIPKEKVIVSNYGVREDVDLIYEYKKQIKTKNKVVLYLPEICTNSEIKYSKSLNIKRINTTMVPIYKIYLD